MALGDVLLKQLTKNKDKVGAESTTTSDKIKGKAALIISVFAAIFSVNAFIQNQLASKVLNNTIVANDLYNFYQAKSIKQTTYELAAQQTSDPAKAKKFADKAASYDLGDEGKPALFKQAKALEDARDHYKKQLPWVGYASTAYQLSIVLLSASILSVSMALFWGSFVMAGAGIFLMLQGFMLFL